MIRESQVFLKLSGRDKESWVYVPKTYYCFGAKDKFSCRGVNKKFNDINKDKYLNVLLTKQNSAGVNRGFRVVNNTMYTYEQVRDAFSYFYPKRKVLADGVSTTPLDI